MKNDEYKILKEKFEQLQAKRNEVLNLQKEIALLEEKEEVRKYLNLLDMLDEKTSGRNQNITRLTDRDIINIALRETKITPDEETYVYLGTYKYNNEVDIEHGASDFLVNRNDKNADYVLYQLLESYYCNNVQIPYKEAGEFENTHKVIIPRNVKSNERYFYDLQSEYFETMILKSPEEANQNIKRLLKKEQ